MKGEASKTSFRDLGMTLSLPYNFADDYINSVLLPYADITSEVYLAVFWAISPSARNWMGAGTHREYLRKIDGLYKVAQGHGIRLNFVANVAMDPRQARLIVDEAVFLHERYPDSSFTLRSLEVAVALKHEAPDVQVSPSTLAFIDSPVKAMYWKLAVNPDVLTVAREVNRRPAVLRQFKDMGFKVKLIPEDTCIPYCPVMHEHDMSIALRDQLNQASTVPIPLRAGECRPFAMRIKADPRYFWLVATKDVLPGHLKHLKGLVDILKIEGRQAGSDVIRQKVEYYEEPEDAWERIATCDRDCFRCKWCAENIRFIGTSIQGIPSPGETVQGVDDSRTRNPGGFTSARLDFTRKKDGGTFSIEITPLESGRAYFRKTGVFGLAYIGKTEMAEVTLVIERLAVILQGMEHDPAFNISSIRDLLTGKSWTSKYQVKFSLKRATRKG